MSTSTVFVALVPVTVVATDQPFLPGIHAYGGVWFVQSQGFEGLVDGRKLPKYLAKRLDTAIDNSDGTVNSRGDYCANVTFTEVELALFRGADTTDAARNAVGD